MRLVRLIAVVMITAAQAGCAGLAPPWLAAPAPEAAVPADLDSILYGRGVPAVPVTPVVPAALPVPAGPPFGRASFLARCWRPAFIRTFPT